MLFASFLWDGYKIASLDSIEQVALDAPVADLNNSDNDLTHSSPAPSELSDQSPAFTPEPYKMAYANFSFLPRVMLDYGKVKAGSYFYSSDALDRYSVLGGVAVNSAFDLEAFSIFEFKRFAPTLFLELYAFSFHIDERIEIIEDFPKTEVNIRFNLLEADLGLRYRVANLFNLRAAFIHSRYTSKIGDFYFQDIRWKSPDNTYFIGNHFALAIQHEGIKPSMTSGIAPAAGRRVFLSYRHELNQFFEDFSTDNSYGTIQELYTDYNYNLFELDWQEYLTVPLLRHALGMRLRAGYIDRPIDSFFNFFLGGLHGMRGYPYYSIEGRKKLLASASYRFPMLRNFKKRFLFLTFDKLYAGAYVDFGNAFDEDRLDWNDFKTDVGLQLRAELFSFYAYPTRIFVDTCYGLDEFLNKNSNQLYGKEWRFYFGIAFDFFD